MGPRRTSARLPVGLRAQAAAALAGLALGLLLPRAGRAQGQAAAGTSAVVVGGNIGVQAQRNLDFGDVLPGVRYDVAVIDNRAGKWRITGTPGAELQLGFLLPSTLSDGAHTMPISFEPDQAGHFLFDIPALATLFDPNTGTIADLRGFFGGFLFVWIGGRATPAAAQAQGVYTGTITLVASYTGN